MTIALVALGTLSANAQSADNDDTNVDQHELQVLVQEVALLDIWDASLAVPADVGIITFDMADATTNGINAEAGLYDFAALSYSDLYLNYTSVVSAAEPTRNISVRLNGGSFPGGLQLVITPEESTVENPDNGVPGTIDTANPIRFTSNDITTGASQNIVTQIESVYTGDEANGVKLLYTLEQFGSFSNYIAGNYSTQVVYTLSDL
ncbi:hypothetical protein ATE92_0752 [Ulvibacter sp. MAR_2010_11]|uniref:hypothetical protein n=1 Tax=Ulvibacter sp. MAR_2010_11 TaxID=1250229 RepID=UPI000CAAE6BE|nr:hypothetical protein [Ulvibacter sp. MAR_2010_11]PKA82618.1 hypothetical protein ATE92_0752 [Ulvibacter sp. MAR_2010_11]